MKSPNDCAVFEKLPVATRLLCHGCPLGGSRRWPLILLVEDATLRDGGSMCTIRLSTRVGIQ
jgi:hypothetical protein